MAGLRTSCSSIARYVLTVGEQSWKDQGQDQTVLRVMTTSGEVQDLYALMEEQMPSLLMGKGVTFLGVILVPSRDLGCRTPRRREVVWQGASGPQRGDRSYDAFRIALPTTHPTELMDMDSRREYYKLFPCSRLGTGHFRRRMRRQERLAQSGQSEG